MKPIIVDMNDMSDSTEAYEAKPTLFLIYTIYLILIILISAVLWMSLSKMDVVVKNDGVFKGSNIVYEISSGVTGSIKENHVINGQYVNEGDVLYVINIEELSDTILRYQDELKALTNRIEILSAYSKSLDDDKGEFEACKDNPYYEEFEDRRELLLGNVKLNESDTNGQADLYRGNIDSITETISKYDDKVAKLNTAKQCIYTQKNTLDISDGFFYSMVCSYLSSYGYSCLQYDNQINEYQRQIAQYDEQLIRLEHTLVNEAETVSGNDASGNSIIVDVDNLKKQRDNLIVAREATKREKTKALSNMELQQITAIEQMISGYNDSILSLQANLTTARLQLENVNSVDNETKKSTVILKEKGAIATEILRYEEKQKECESYLKSYDIQNNNCVIKANVSGYFYASQDFRTGGFVQEGLAIGTIYPTQESKYYAEIYVRNSDIAKIRVGQEVKFEIAAYPSSEYGSFEGMVESIAKDISVDRSTGYSYYLVKVQCNDMTFVGKKGEEVTLLNGMACQAKIVVGEKNVLTYLLEKIDLID